MCMRHSLPTNNTKYELDRGTLMDTATGQHGAIQTTVQAPLAKPKLEFSQDELETETYINRCKIYIYMSIFL